MFKSTILFMVLLFLTGCSSVQPLQIPNIKNNTESKGNINNPKATIALTKIIQDFDRGSEIISFPNQGTYKGQDSVYCNMRDAARYTWTGGRRLLGDWSTDFGKDFHDVMINNGYKVAGNTSEMFFQNQAVSSAEFIIAARIIDLKGNFCHLHHWWDGRPLNQFSGEAYTKIEWSVLNSLTKEVVLKTLTEGYGIQPTPIVDGVYATTSLSLIEATNAFSQNETLRKLVTGNRITVDKVINTDLPKIIIQKGKLSNKFSIENIKPYIVTIRVGLGHGSGLIIGKNGYILTNAHVVGNAKNVQIITPLGLEIEGTVIHKNKVRDVALIKTPLKLRRPISINQELPKVGNEIFAVGSPLKEELSLTVTKGIVSAIRTDAATGKKFIQGDVSISPGNSGGPLFDKQGNVIGLSVAKYTGNNTSGLNLFIPINEVFKKLNLN